MTLLETAQSGNLVHLRERLQHVVDKFGSCGGRMTIDEKLLDEALTFARLGDLDEATHLLRLRARPKYTTEDLCRAAYKRAMKEKRRGGKA